MREAQINELLSKYYKRRTSLEEEKRLRRLLKKADGFEMEKLFFLGVDELGHMEPVKKAPPKPSYRLANWQKVAAVVLVFVTLGWLFVQEQRSKQEEEAYAKVMEAMALIQENLHRGATSLQVMEEMKHLSTPHELFNIKELKEEEQ